MTDPTLADTFFLGGAEDKLAAVDVYTQTSADEPIDITAVDGATDSDALQGMMGGNLAPPEEILKSYSPTEGLVLDTNALRNGIINANGALRSAIGTVSSGIKDAVMVAKGINNIKATINGITASIKRGKLSDIVGIANLIGGLSGRVYPIAFNDLAGMANLSTNVLKQAAELGIPNAYDQIASGIASVPGLLNEVTRNILPIVALTSDVNMLMNIARGPCRNNIRSMNPGFIGSFAKNYKLPPKTSQAAQRKIGNQISCSFSSIDPNWNKTIKSNGALVNCSNVLNKASSDLRKVMLVANTLSRISSVIIPRTVGVFTPANAPPLPPMPGGTTAQTVITPQGNTVVTYTYPDGRVFVNTTTPNGGQITQEMSYPSQSNVPGLNTQGSNAVMCTNSSGLYSGPTDVLTNPEDYNDPLDIGSNAVTTKYSQANGDIVHVTKYANGNEKHTFTSLNGNVVTTHLTASDDMVPDVLEGDPLVGTSYNLNHDSLAMNSATLDLFDKSDQEASYRGRTSITQMNANEALSDSFPELESVGMDYDFA